MSRQTSTKQNAQNYRNFGIKQPSNYLANQRSLEHIQRQRQQNNQRQKKQNSEFYQSLKEQMSSIQRKWEQKSSAAIKKTLPVSLEYFKNVEQIKAQLKDSYEKTLSQQVKKIKNQYETKFQQKQNTIMELKKNMRLLQSKEQNKEDFQKTTNSIKNHIKEESHKMFENLRRNFDSQINKGLTQHANFLKQIEDLSNQLKATKSRYQQDTVSLNKSISSLNSLNTDLRQKNQDLERQIQNLKLDSQTKSKLIQAQKKIVNLQKIMQQKENFIKTKDQQISILKSQKSDLSIEQQNISKQLANFYLEIKKAKQHLFDDKQARYIGCDMSMFSQKTKQLKGLVINKQGALQTTKKITYWIIESEKLQTKIYQLNSQKFRELQDELNDNRQKINILNGQKDMLSINLQKEMEENEQLTKKLEQLKNEYKLLNQSTAKTINQLTKEKTNLTNQKQTLISQKAKLFEAKQKMQSDLKRKIEELKSLLENTRIQLKSQKNQNQKLRLKISNLQKQITKLKEQINKLKNSIAQLTQTLASNVKTIANLQQKILYLEQEKQKLTQNNDFMQQTLKSINKNLVGQLTLKICGNPSFLSLQDQPWRQCGQIVNKIYKSFNQQRFFTSSSTILTSHVQFIINSLSQATPKKPALTKLLYRFDPLSNVSFHKYYDNKDNIMILIKLCNGQIIGGFSEFGVAEGNVKKSGNGILFSVTQQKVFKPKPDHNGFILPYDSFYFMMGSSELRIRIGGETKLFSNYGITAAVFDTLKFPKAKFLGTTDSEPEMESYEIYQIKFEE